MNDEVAGDDLSPHFEGRRAPAPEVIGRPRLIVRDEDRDAIAERLADMLVAQLDDQAPGQRSA